jgi:TonB family protein
MSVYDQDKKTLPNRIFISYSSIDRIRTTGLALLLEAMGHQVFHDHRTIKPGMQWKAALQDGLDDATAVMVFWTKHAERSDWVRKEYEYFTAKYPDRVLIPVLGDETPLTELLKTRQQADFVPVVNEVLAKKRDMKKAGAGSREIEEAVRERLKEEGVDVSTGKHKRLLFLFLGFGWLLTLLRYPWSWPQKASSAAVEGTAQATAGQVTVLAAATALGVGGSYQVAENKVRDELPELTSLQEENEDLLRSHEELQQDYDELLASSREFDDMQRAIDNLGTKVNGLIPTGSPASCISPDSFNSCQTGIQTATLGMNTRLDGMAKSLDRIAGQTAANQRAGEVTSSDLTMGTQDFGDCDIAPQAIEQQEPDYPTQARHDNTQGGVTVHATIDTDGNVSVDDAAGESGILNTAATDTVNNWTFTPCSIGDQKYATSFIVNIDFKLHD